MGFAVGLPVIPEVTLYECVDLDQLESTVTRHAATYWSSRCGSNRMPARKDINPRDIASALRHMYLLKVLDEDFHYRIVGDAVVRAYTVPLQNRRLSEIGLTAPKLAAIARGFYTRILHTAGPFAVRGRIGRDVPQANFTEFEIVLLPLGIAHDTVDHILGVSTYHMQPDRC